MKVKPVTVGPIVGATSATAVRIWGRGEYEQTQTGPRRCFGVARIRQSTNGRYSNPKYFKMNPNFDMTGLTIFNNLKPATKYNYQIGWFFSDLEPEELEASKERQPEWGRAPLYHFTTGTADDQELRSFIFGSCRYLLRLFDGRWPDNRGDKTYRSILRQVDAGKRTDAILMIGDQIYADDLNQLHNDKVVDAYLRRYRDAFTQPNIRSLMSRIPTYMTLDDHEIEDGWPSHSSDQDWMIKYPAAIHAFKIYQLSHSPAMEADDDRLIGIPNKYWYTFSDGCADFFVTDTRTERFMTSRAAKREIISQTQMDAIKSWLTDGSGRVKFLASSVPVFPSTKAGEGDKWGGFPTQRSELLDFIWENRVKRVVFLAGDVHSSLSAELRKEGDKSNFKVISLISSPYYWPYPHSPRRAFNLGGKIKSTLSGNVYKVVNPGDVHAVDNFTRVTVTLDGLTVEIYDRKGIQLDVRAIKFAK